MLILNFFAATALLSSTVAGLPIGPAAFGVIPPTIKAHPNAPFNRHNGDLSLLLGHPPSPKKVPARKPFDFDLEMGKLAILMGVRKSPPKAAAAPAVPAAAAAAAVPKAPAAPSRWVKTSHGVWQKKRPEGSILRGPADRPDPSAPKKKVTWSPSVVGKRSEKNEDVEVLDGGDLEKRMGGHRLRLKVKAAFMRKPRPVSPSVPVPKYPEHRPEGSVVLYPAGHPDAKVQKEKKVNWAPGF
ncbi:hypothetical protein HYFRA_00011583 [Hymenoscyphus fraxineus]|uniref:Uncharacterized protein n=1 Tax=Hymenoscyphus fraxineus TaxID=746836 RepID=A0A9N9L6Q6_9HELO|nr:hypothetical protein HYFRA_00011583 [Hymenoscyphus fraxineus]